ncbi:hypothetical protein SL1157_1766 [Ruegeria lacuscaerulensis ITI-1157]|nr:hypothetical protein SL1157_1766 [Ruegeria lacuscaerulensis ITI-1157]
MIGLNDGTKTPFNPVAAGSAAAPAARRDGHGTAARPGCCPAGMATA